MQIHTSCPTTIGGVGGVYVGNAVLVGVLVGVAVGVTDGVTSEHAQKSEAFGRPGPA